MNDAAIRELLYPQLNAGVYIDELDTGPTRADVVHVTADWMHCYELKGDDDSLKRAPAQLRQYARAYDYVTFIITERHLPRLQQLVPEWVGIIVARPGRLDKVQSAQVSPHIERGPLALLLRAAEVKQYLRDLGEKGIQKLRNHELSAWLTAADHIPLQEISQYVRRQLIDQLPQRVARRQGRRQQTRDAQAARMANRLDLQEKMRRMQQEDPAWYEQWRGYYEGELSRL